MSIALVKFQREARRRIGETFPRNRIPFYQSLHPHPAFAAFHKIGRLLGDEEKSWRVFLLALHVLYEGCHDLPPLTVGQRKSVRRDAESLRAMAGRLQEQGFLVEVGKVSGVLEKIASELDRAVHPSTDALYSLVDSRGRRLAPKEAIPIFELARLFRQRLSEVGFYPVIVDLMNAVPGHSRKFNVATVKKRLAQLEGVGFQPRVQFIYDEGDVLTLTFRGAPGLGPVRVSR